MSNLRSITGGGQKDKLAELVRNAQAEFPAYLELIELEAKRKKALFDAYVKAGFTTEQALTLTK